MLGVEGTSSSSVCESVRIEGPFETPFSLHESVSSSVASFTFSTFNVQQGAGRLAALLLRTLNWCSISTLYSCWNTIRASTIHPYFFSLNIWLQRIQPLDCIAPLLLRPSLLSP